MDRQLRFTNGAIGLHWAGGGLSVWAVATLCLSFLPVSLGQELQPSAASHGLRLTAVPVTEKVHLGEPFFIKVTLRNETEQALPVWFDTRLVGNRWHVEIAKDGDEFEEISVKDLWAGGGDLYQLAPGEGGSGFLTMWLRLEYRRDGHQRLFFENIGRYRYRLTLTVSVGPGFYQREDVALTVEGTVEVLPPRGPREERAMAALTQPLDNYPLLINPSLLELSPKMRGALESALSELGDSPYASYLRWLLLIRAAGYGGEPDSVVEQLADEILADKSLPDCPIVLNALAAKMSARTKAGDMEGARETFLEMERRFPDTWERDLGRLRHKYGLLQADSADAASTLPRRLKPVRTPLSAEEAERLKEVAQSTPDTSEFDRVMARLYDGLDEGQYRDFCFEQAQKLAAQPKPDIWKLHYFLSRLEPKAPPREIAVLRNVLSIAQGQQRQQLRGRCIRVLSAWASGDAEWRRDALNDIRAQLSHPDSWTRAVAAKALSRSGDVMHVLALAPMLDDNDETVRWRAAEGICKLLGWPVTPLRSREDTMELVDRVKRRLPAVLKALEALETARQTP